MKFPLSPASQKVLAALTQDECELDPADIPSEAQRMARHASVAIRAAAEQVVPEQKPWNRTNDAGAAKHAVRIEFLAIADELEAG
jgi:hypothetical protein